MSGEPHDITHRMLEGVLLRLSRRPDAREIVVRGGMLLRHWLRPLPRPAEDLDLVATFPFDIVEAKVRFLPVLAEEVPDGVSFETDRVRVDGIWLSTGSPGVRVFVTGTFGDTEADLHIDVTFGPYPRPAPIFTELPTAFGEPARVWACRPEAVAGHKLQALCHRGMLGWRPKDLDDLHLLLARVPMDITDLRAALGAYLADVGASLDDARGLFAAGSWWELKMSSARWLDYARETTVRAVPRILSEVVAEVAARLLPVLEGSP